MLPPSDAQLSRLLPRHPQRPQIFMPPHSIPSSVPATPSSIPSRVPPVTPPLTALPSMPTLSVSAPQFPDKMASEHAVDFATSSWDLATGGLKTLTAKRELPSRLERRSIGHPTGHPTGIRSDASSSSRSYAFILILLSCLVLMLIGGGVVLFVMLQP